MYILCTYKVMFWVVICAIICIKNWYNSRMEEDKMELTEIIERISHIRTKYGMSARELSLSIGKNPSYINRLEYRKDFEPTIGVINDILEVCNSSFEEFFYENMDEYQTDKQLLNLIKKLPNDKKESLIKLLS